MPEAVVHPDHQLPHRAAAQQHLLHEPLGAERGQRRVEAQHHHVLRPELGQDLALLRRERQPAGRGRGREHRGRVRLEGHHHRRRPEPLGAG